MVSVWNGNGKGMEKLITYRSKSISAEMEWIWNGIGEMEWNIYEEIWI